MRSSSPLHRQMLRTKTHTKVQKSLSFDTIYQVNSANFMAFWKKYSQFIWNRQQKGGPDPSWPPKSDSAVYVCV